MGDLFSHSARSACTRLARTGFFAIKLTGDFRASHRLHSSDVGALSFRAQLGPFISVSRCARGAVELSPHSKVQPVTSGDRFVRLAARSWPGQRARSQLIDLAQTGAAFAATQTMIHLLNKRRVRAKAMDNGIGLSARVSVKDARAMARRCYHCCRPSQLPARKLWTDQQRRLGNWPTFVAKWVLMRRVAPMAGGRSSFD